MTISRVTLLMALLVSLPVGAQGDKEMTISEREVMDLIATIPIKRMQAPPEVREKQRSEGRPVMRVVGQPGYLYRDFVRAAEQGRRSLRMPQENPDYLGCVTVSFEILADGKTSAFEVVKSDPKGVFDKHALGAVFATEYEPAPASAGPAPRHQRSIWFLVARPPRGEFSKINDAVEKDRNKRREEQRVACEGPSL